MAKLSKVDAAKAAGVSRQTLYTYIKDHRISVDADGLIDTAELFRSGFTLHDVGRPETLHTGQNLTSSIDTLDVYREMIDTLKQQLREAQAREQVAVERERVARDREALLLQMLQEAHQRYDHLLEAPKPVAPAPRIRVHAAGGEATPEAPPFDATKYVLGALCPRRHEYGTTGQSLLRLANHGCLKCDAEKARERRRQTHAGR
jgi:hypothetical protein